MGQAKKRGTLEQRAIWAQAAKQSKDQEVVASATPDELEAINRTRKMLAAEDSEKAAITTDAELLRVHREVKANNNASMAKAGYERTGSSEGVAAYRRVTQPGK